MEQTGDLGQRKEGTGVEKMGRRVGRTSRRPVTGGGGVRVKVRTVIKRTLTDKV